MLDIGLTHIALPVSDIEQSIKFYATYAEMKVVHRRIDKETVTARKDDVSAAD
jgi:catechol 2,3-dioxygenase-like lactoylglutathione lyase family enzyme